MPVPPCTFDVSLLGTSRYTVCGWVPYIAAGPFLSISGTENHEEGFFLNPDMSVGNMNLP